jgi:hypothetical protein
MLVGTDFLWKAMPVGSLRELLAQFSDQDWIYADRDGDLSIIRAENFSHEKNKAYPGDAVIDLMTEQITPGKRRSGSD